MVSRGGSCCLTAGVVDQCSSARSPQPSSSLQVCTSPTILILGLWGLVIKCQMSNSSCFGVGVAGGDCKGRLALSQLQAVRAFAFNKSKSKPKEPVPCSRNSPGFWRNQEANKAALGSAHTYLFHKGGGGAGVTTNRMPPMRHCEPQTR